jgi:hypothetical protein
MCEIINIGEENTNLRPQLLFVGGKSAKALTTIPAKQWPTAVIYAETNAKDQLLSERAISQYIIKNNNLIGAIIWDPLADLTIRNNHRLGQVYDNELDPFKISSLIIKSLRTWSKILTSGRIIINIPFIADIYRANSYYKKNPTLQKRRVEILSDNMKITQQKYDIIFEHVTDRINHTFPKSDAEKIIILEFRTLVPNWCRNKDQLEKSLLDDRTFYPSLHQNFSFEGIFIGSSQLAGDIFSAYLESKLSFLPKSQYKLPDITNFEKYLKHILGTVMYKLFKTNRITNNDRKRLKVIKKKLTAKKLKLALQNYSAPTATLVSTCAGQSSPSQAGPSSAGPVTVTIPATHVTLVQEVDADESRPVSPIIPPPFRNFITPIRFDIEQPDDDIPLPVDRIVTEKPDVFHPEFRCLRRDNLRIAILGHSFVNHLEHYFPSKPTTNTVLRFYGEPGAKLAKHNKFHFKNYQVCQDWINYRPHLTFIILGGNDVEKVGDADKLFNYYKNLTDLIKWKGTYMAVAIETRFTTRGLMSPRYFNYTVGKFNTRLYRDSPRQYVALPPHFAESRSRETDGIHLTQRSNEELRHTILFHLRSVANIA